MASPIVMTKTLKMIISLIGKMSLVNVLMMMVLVHNSKENCRSTLAKIPKKMKPVMTHLTVRKIIIKIEMDRVPPLLLKLVASMDTPLSLKVVKIIFKEINFGHIHAFKLEHHQLCFLMKSVAAIFALSVWILMQYAGMIMPCSYTIRHMSMISIQGSFKRPLNLTLMLLITLPTGMKSDASKV